MKNNVEFRAADWEASESGENTITGYAVVFEQRTVLYKDPQTGYEYGEIIDRAALDGADMSDVILRYDHAGRVLARTRNQSLRLSVDDHGLLIEADLSGSDEARSYYEDVKSGLIDKMSFCFEVAAEEWDEATRTRRVKSIARLYDVSLVSFPAYEQTQVNARKRFEELAAPDLAAYLTAETRSVCNEIRAGMDDFSVLCDATPDDFKTDADIERIKTFNKTAPYYAQQRYDEKEPVFREMAIIKSKLDGFIESRNLEAARSVRGRFNELRGKLLSIEANRRSIAAAVAAGAGVPIENFKLNAKGTSMKNTTEKRAFFADVVEKRAAATTSTMSAVIPQNVIDQYVIETTPGAFFEDASKTAIAHAGNLKLPIASLQNVEKHVENAELATNGFVPGYLSIEHDEYAYNTGYSDLGVQLSVEALESIVDATLIASMLKKMDGICIDAAASLEYADDVSAVKIAKAVAPMFADFIKLAAMLGKDYIDRAKWYMSAPTFFSWVLGLKDDNKRPLFDASKAIAEQAPLGYPIRIDSQLPTGVIYFGAGAAVHLNYAREPELRMWDDNDHNMKKLGVRAVAGAACESGAFVKMYAEQ